MYWLHFTRIEQLLKTMIQLNQIQTQLTKKKVLQILSMPVVFSIKNSDNVKWGNL